jgi:S1-C subfamily serine protease
VLGALHRWWKVLSAGERRFAVACVGILVVLLPMYWALITMIVSASPGAPGYPGDSPPDARQDDTSKSPTVLPTPPLLTANEVVARGSASAVAVGVASYGRRGLDIGYGSGIVVEGGRILTNAHVVKDAVAIVVATPDGRLLGAEILGVDAARDLALMQTGVGDLKPATLGDSARLGDLEEVVALGYPLAPIFADAAPTPAYGRVSKPLAVIPDVQGEKLRDDQCEHQLRS